MDRKLRDELEELKNKISKVTHENSEKLDDELTQVNELRHKFDCLKEELISKEEEVEKYFRFLPAMQSEVSMLRTCLKDNKIPIPSSKIKK
jgi:hypothetical protein